MQFHQVDSMDQLMDTCKNKLNNNAVFFVDDSRIIAMNGDHIHGLDFATKKIWRQQHQKMNGAFIYRLNDSNESIDCYWYDMVICNPDITFKNETVGYVLPMHIFTEYLALIGRLDRKFLKTIQIDRIWSLDKNGRRIGDMALYEVSSLKEIFPTTKKVLITNKITQTKHCFLDKWVYTPTLENNTVERHKIIYEVSYWTRYSCMYLGAMYEHRCVKMTEKFDGDSALDKARNRINELVSFEYELLG